MRLGPLLLLVLLPACDAPAVQAVARARDGVVTIRTERRTSWGTVKTRIAAGVVLDAAGHVVTCRHVSSGALSLGVELADGTAVRSRVVAEVEGADLALLLITTPAKLHPLALADADALVPGQTVLALGHPHGYQHSVSQGVVSALGRDVDPGAGRLVGLVQHTAPLHPGCSGGPLLNLAGEVVGINVAIHDGAPGVGFALPAGAVRRALARHLPPH